MDLGTVNYHLRALRSHALWAPFRAVVGSVLRPEFFAGRRVCLVGPSLGYVLPLELLSDAQAFVVLDRDHIVTRFLPRKLEDRAGRTNPRLPSDIQVVRVQLHTKDGLEALSALRGQHVIFLFCNVLGQLKYSWLSERTPAPAELNRAVSRGQTWFESLGRQLAEEQWISFHDRISFEDLRPVYELPGSFESSRRLSEEALFTSVRGFAKRGDLSSGFESHWMDFLSLKQGPFIYAPWKLIPRRTHWIEFASSTSLKLHLQPKG